MEGGGGHILYFEETAKSVNKVHEKSCTIISTFTGGYQVLYSSMITNNCIVCTSPLDHTTARVQ